MLKECVRETDQISRWGGEEFLILLPEGNGEAAVIIAEKIREIIDKSEFEFAGNKVRFTVSIGVKHFIYNDMSIDTIIKNVDDALYAAKNSGRNKVVAS